MLFLYLPQTFCLSAFHFQVHIFPGNVVKYAHKEGEEGILLAGATSL